MSARAVVSLSGGVSSWCAGRRYIDEHGTAGVIALFADTGVEHPDTYRFLEQSAVQLSVPLVWLNPPGSEQKTIWGEFRRARFLGNSRIDVCSRAMKREPINVWLKANAPSADVVVGIDWQEEFRFTRLRDRGPWRYVAPLCDAPFLGKDDQHAMAEAAGLQRQHLYRIGADHANCGGGCVKMGMGGFARLLRTDPAAFAMWEANEDSLRAELGDVAILTDRRGGGRVPFTLGALRKRIESKEQFEMEEQAACGCFVGPAAPTPQKEEQP